MARKLPKCTIGKNHSWTHIRNVRISTVSMHRNGSRSAVIKNRGEYACDCGAKKDGRSM